MVIARVKEKLLNYPHVTYTIKDNYLEIPAQTPTGFSVWIQERADGCTVGFEGWHEEFASPDESLKCFAFGLSRDCLLRVSRRGNVDFKWQVFHQENGKWVADSETGLLVFRFWRRTVRRDLQNDIIKG
jgi:hypothetical protein